MSALAYGGLVLTPSTLRTAVATAVGGRIPRPRHGAPPTDDPVDWLGGLWTASRGEALAESVDHELHTALRTGGPSQLAVLAALARHHGTFDADTLRDALTRPAVQGHRAAAHDLGLALSQRIVEGQVPYDPLIRELVVHPRLGPGLIGVVLERDEDWALEQLAAWLRTPRVVTRLDGLVAEGRAPEDRVASAVARAWDALSDTVQRAIRGHRPGWDPAEPEEGSAGEDDVEPAGPSAPTTGASAAPPPGAAPPPEPGPEREDAPAPEPLTAAPRPPSMWSATIDWGDAPRRAPERAASPAAAPLHIAQLPWRGEDGCWFLVPEQTELAEGPFALSRGGETRGVERRAVAVYQIPRAEALRLRGGQLGAALTALLGEAIRAEVAGPDPSALLTDAEAREAAAARVRALTDRLAGLPRHPAATTLRERLAGALREDGEARGGPVEPEPGAPEAVGDEVPADGEPDPTEA